MSDLNKKRSFYSLKPKGKSKDQDGSTEALIPSGAAASTSTPSLGKRAKSMIGLSKKAGADAAPPLPQGLPKNLSIYADIKPGVGSRDRVTDTPTTSPTTERGVRLEHTAIRADTQAFKDRLDSKMSDLERRELLSQATLGKSDRGTPKMPPRHTHAPTTPGAWVPPGTEQSRPANKIEQVTHHFPSVVAGKTVNSTNADLKGTLARSSEKFDKPDRRGRDVYPRGSDGRAEYDRSSSPTAAQPSSKSKGKKVDRSGPSVG